MMASQTSHWISKKCRQSSTQRSLGLVNSGTGIRQPPESTTIPLHPLFMGPPERGRLCWGESRPPRQERPGACLSLPREAGVELRLHSLFRLEVPVDDTQVVQVVQAQGQLSQVKLHVLLREHHLQKAGGGVSGSAPSSTAGAPSSQQLPGPDGSPWGGPLDTPVPYTLLFTEGVECGRTNIQVTHCGTVWKEQKGWEESGG